MQKIMFSDKFGLTQAVLEGRKTMTRRIIEAPKTWHGLDVYGFSINKDHLGNVTDITLIGANGESIEDESGSLGMILPKYKVGETVAVAQNYISIMEYYHSMGSLDKRTESDEEKVFWREMRNFETYGNDSAMRGDLNKMFVRADLMPHQIRITDIKVERLQDISDEDCLKEGIYSDVFDDSGILTKGYMMIKDDGKLYPTSYYEIFDSPREAFAVLMDKVSGKGTWEKNPWVFAYSFELID